MENTAMSSMSKTMPNKLPVTSSDDDASGTIGTIRKEYCAFSNKHDKFNDITSVCKATTAITDGKKLIEKYGIEETNKTFPEIYFNLAELYVFLRDFTNAEQYCKLAIKVGYEALTSYTYEALIDIYSKTGDIKNMVATSIVYANRYHTNKTTTYLFASIIFKVATYYDCGTTIDRDEKQAVIWYQNFLAHIKKYKLTRENLNEMISDAKRMIAKYTTTIIYTVITGNGYFDPVKSFKTEAGAEKYKKELLAKSSRAETIIKMSELEE
jgi:tetratricopeptide (TPR) repeat protein